MYYKFSFSEGRQTILPYLWVNLKKYLEDTYDMEVNEEIPGDGYCFLSSVVDVLHTNFDEKITVEQVMQKMMKYVCDNYEKYERYHTQGKEDLEPTVADTLTADIIDFFSSRNFNTNVVDLLMQNTADALGLELFIYQENGAQIQIIHFTGLQPMRTVRLKFKHDNLHPLGNHYQSIIEKSKSSKSVHLRNQT